MAPSGLAIRAVPAHVALRGLQSGGRHAFRVETVRISLQRRQRALPRVHHHMRSTASNGRAECLDRRLTITT